MTLWEITLDLFIVCHCPECNLDEFQHIVNGATHCQYQGILFKGRQWLQSVGFLGESLIIFMRVIMKAECISAMFPPLLGSFWKSKVRKKKVTQ